MAAVLPRPFAAGQVGVGPASQPIVAHRETPGTEADMRRSSGWVGCLSFVLAWGVVWSAGPAGADESLLLTQGTAGPAAGAGPGTQTATATPPPPTPRPRPATVPRSRAPEMLGDQAPPPIPLPQPQPQPMPPILIGTVG